MKSAVAVFVAAILCLGAVSRAGADQPHMRAAIALLNDAKKSGKPLPALRAAKRHLEEARRDKHGERRDAVKAVNEAISYPLTGDSNKMQQKIDHAVAQIYSGIRQAR